METALTAFPGKASVRATAPRLDPTKHRSTKPPGPPPGTGPEQADRFAVGALPMPTPTTAATGGATQSSAGPSRRESTHAAPRRPPKSKGSLMAHPDTMAPDNAAPST